MNNVVSLTDYRKAQQSKRMTEAVRNADIEGVIDEFLFDLDLPHPHPIFIYFTLMYKYNKNFINIIVHINIYYYICFN